MLVVKEWVDTVKDFKKKRFECQPSKENGAGLRVNGRGL